MYKKIVFLTLISMLLTYGAERKVLGELLTSTTCGPCKNADAHFDQMANNYDYLVPICYHVWWPGDGSDPFYWNNPNDNKSRNNYYGNNYVPHLFVNGTDQGSSGSWESVVDDFHSIPAPVFIDVYTKNNVSALKADDYGKTGSIMVHIVSDTADQIKAQLRVAITIDGVEYHAPNGVNEHNHAMLDMYPSAWGSTITLAPAADTILEFDYTIQDTIYFPEGLNPDELYHVVDPESCNVVVFMQDDINDNTMSVYQANMCDVVKPYNMEIVYSNMKDANDNGKLEPGEEAEVFVTVTNNGDASVKDIKLMMDANNPHIQLIDSIVDVSDNIGQGESYKNDAKPFKIKATDEYTEGEELNARFIVTKDTYYNMSSTNLGIVENKIDNFAEITNGSIHINASKWEVLIFSIDGTKTKEIKGNGAKEISLKDLNTGLYFVKIITNERTLLKKLIIP